MSPEIFSSRAYDYKSDVWSLGCVLYEMAALDHPFDAQTLQGLGMKVMRGRYKAINSAWYDVHLRNMVRDLLALNPKKRPTLKELLVVCRVRMLHEVPCRCDSDAIWL